MRSFGVFLCLSFSIFWAQAQEDEQIRISGQTLSGDSLQPAPNVHILINGARNAGSVTGADGRFSVTIEKKDTLWFTAVGYHTAKVAFADSAEIPDFVSVVLQPKTYTLKPVEVFAYDLQEILDRQKEKPFTLERDDPEPLFEPKEREEKPAVSVGVSPSGGATLDGAITAFAGLFNKEFKQRKKLKALLASENAAARIREQQKMLEDNYKEIARQAANLDSADFNQFVSLYMPDADFLLNANDYEIARRILEDYQDYRYRFKLEEVSLDELLQNARFRK